MSNLRLKRYISQKVIEIDSATRSNHWYLVAEFEDGTIRESHQWRHWADYEPFSLLEKDWQEKGEQS